MLRPFTQYFVEAPLAVITASSIVGYEATSFIHTCIWGVSSILLCRSSSSVRLDGARRFTAIFRCSIGFKSGFWLGHLRTFRDLSRSHSCVVLTVLRVIVLLEAEPLPQSEDLSALEQVFIKGLSVLCSLHLCLDPD